MRRVICAALLHATAALVAPTTSLPRRAHRRHAQHRQPTRLSALPLAAAVRSAAELRFDAYEWCANYAAPASLVAGAVIASLRPRDRRRRAASPTRINNFVSSSLCTLIILMAAIYNDHTEYQNYLQMLRRLAFLVAALLRALAAADHARSRCRPCSDDALGFRALASPQDDDNGAPA
ncbi:hypothetical protein JL720_16726 [Aureococcus anophagefferens]|nr:hypothetical protein JL720_16726 [Aureococcus anophagefferens]